MSNKLTAEEYLDTQLALGWDYIDIETAETYGDLRAKEAVEKFARELIAQSETWQNQSGEVDDVVSVDDIQLSVVHAIGSSQLESKKGGGE